MRIRDDRVLVQGAGLSSLAALPGGEAKWQVHANFMQGRRFRPL